MDLPCSSIEKVVSIADSILTPKLNSKNILVEKRIIDKVYLETLNVIHKGNISLFQGLDDHVEVSVLGSHRNKLIRRIVGYFVTMRAKHFCKEKNSVDVKVRMQLSKLILFKNQ